MDADRIVASLQAANVAAALMMIRKCEGTDAPNGYRYLFGSTPQRELLFDSFADHPRQHFFYRAPDGTMTPTSAAGAYQAMIGTWDDAVRALGRAVLPDFTPASQDRFAVYRIDYRGALDDVMAGRLEAAIDKLGREWASLPSATVAQPRRSLEFAFESFGLAGGTVA